VVPRPQPSRRSKLRPLWRTAGPTRPGERRRLAPGPRLKDLTQIHFGSSTIQVDGDMVPVAELALDAADAVFFEHHAMLWKDETVPMSVMDTPGGRSGFSGTCRSF